MLAKSSRVPFTSRPNNTKIEFGRWVWDLPNRACVWEIPNPSPKLRLEKNRKESSVQKPGTKSTYGENEKKRNLCLVDCKDRLEWTIILVDKNSIQMDNFVPQTHRQTHRHTDTRTHSSSLSIERMPKIKKGRECCDNFA